jgi:hypothetical protein
MKNSRRLSKTFLVLAAGLVSSSLRAADFEWSGTYRIEGIHLSNSEVDDRHRELDYGLHHLSLRPKIVVGDGITINGQFEILNNGAYPDSQLGQVIGSGVGNGVPTSSDDSNAASSHQKSDAFLVSQLYMTWVHEYGALIVGRAPMQFGLGITYNAGRGLFDHWFDTRDLVGYKVVFGNLWILPMYGKVSEANLAQNDDVIDYMIQVQYENPETDLEMGIFYRARKSGDSGSDWPSGTNLVGGAGTTTDKMDMTELSLFALKDSERFRLGVEGSFLSGKMGVVTTTDDQVLIDAFGILAEFDYKPANSYWSFGVKAGDATGDNPDTDSKFEGFAFHRNYDVGMLMFNHPLGRQDVLRSAVYGGGPDFGTSDINKPDVESVSNAIFLSPNVTYRWSDKFSLNALLVYGQLNADPNTAADEGKSLGYEYNFGISYMPRAGVVWKNDIGFLFPGNAFEFNEEKPGFAYGIMSKAAISF